MIQEQKSLASEVARYRIMLVVAMIVYPGWTIIVKVLEPQIESYQALRLSVAGLVFVVFLGSFFIKSNLVSYLRTGLTTCCFVGVIHAGWFLYVSYAPYIEYCGFTILMGTVISIMPSKTSATFLAIATLVFTTILSQMDRHWLMEPLFIPVGMLIALLPSVLATFTRLNHLNEVEIDRLQQIILFSNLEEGVVAIKPNGLIEMVNPAALKLLNTTLEDLKKSNITDSPLLQIGQLAMSSGETLRNQMISVNKNNQIAWLNVNAVSYYINKSEQRCVITFTDITRMKQSQELISQQQSQLFSSAKLSSLGEMAAGIAHEINNPLAIIVGKIALVSRDLESQSTDKVSEHLQKIVDTTMRIKKIISGLHTFARGGEHEAYKTSNLKLMVTEILSFCNERIYHQEIKVQIDIDDSLNLDCRTGQISQVLLNLINNASDAAKSQTEKWIRIHAEQKDKNINIFISDSGSGINTELQHKIMEPFFTTKEVGKGTGLGLSISRGIIQSHSGQLKLIKNSDPTTFLIELPIHQARQNSAA